MRKTPLLFLLFILPFALSAELRSGVGEWRADGYAKAMYETSLGTLFQLQPNEGDGAYIGYRPPHENYASCDCAVCSKGRIRITSVLSLKMPNKLRITTKTRCIALDFLIRVFPALEDDRYSRLRFALLDSQTPISGAMHFNLHGRKIIDENCQDNLYYSGQAPLVLGGHGRTFFHPAFEPLSLRVVYDFSSGQMTYFMNGRKFEYPARFTVTGRTASERLRYFGIVTYGQDHLNHGKHLRKHYFELSPPQVHLCEKADELPAPPQFSAYPYDSYLPDDRSKGRRMEKASNRSDQEDFRKVLHHKNPDLQYAFALRYLYGRSPAADPEKGLELLEHAAKKHHALALYQLGICCWRGYGCRPDLKKAAKYFTRAAELDYPEAAAARLQLEMEQRGRPWFLTELYQKYLKKFPERACGHDKMFYWHMWEFLSPKRLWGHLSVAKVVRFDNPNLNYLDCRLQANDPFSFLPYALSLHKEDPYFKQGEQYLLRAVKSRHHEAYPFWLMSQLYRNKLPEKEKIPLEMQLLHAGHPMFNFVYTLLCLPEAERMKYLVGSGGELRLRPQKEWRMKTPESDFLRAMGLCMWDSFFPDQCLFGLLLADKENKRRTVFELIQASAKAQYAPAQYLMGKFYYYADLPEFYRPINLSPQLSDAERFLTAAAKQGHVPAALLLCKVRLDATFPKYESVLPVLEKLCAMEIPEAFYLKAETLLKMNRLPEALAAADTAVKSGEHRGLLFLGMHDNRVKADVRRSLQLQYIQADRAKRRMDPYDPFWDDPYGEYLKWVSSKSLEIEEKQADHPFGPPIANRRSRSEETSAKSAAKKGRSKGRSKIKFRSE